MDKVIKLIVLTSKEILLSEIEEVGAEIGEPDCKLIKPFELKTQQGDVFLEHWPSFSMQREMMIHSDSILTILDPDKIHLDKYQSLTSE